MSGGAPDNKLHAAAPHWGRGSPHNIGGRRVLRLPLVGDWVRERFYVKISIPQGARGCKAPSALLFPIVFPCPTGPCVRISFTPTGGRRFFLRAEGFAPWFNRC